jgi:hypothetical protein
MNSTRQALGISYSLMSHRSTEVQRVRFSLSLSLSLLTRSNDDRHKVPEHRQNSASFDNWNTLLRVGAKKFSDAHDDATVLIFSSFRAFETFLDDPEVNGFEKKDIRKWGGSVWVDHIHPSSKVHEFIASHVADFLDEVQRVHTA